MATFSYLSSLLTPYYSWFMKKKTSDCTFDFSNNAQIPTLNHLYPCDFVERNDETVNTSKIDFFFFFSSSLTLHQIFNFFCVIFSIFLRNSWFFDSQDGRFKISLRKTTSFASFGKFDGTERLPSGSNKKIDSSSLKEWLEHSGQLGCSVVSYALFWYAD